MQPEGKFLDADQLSTALKPGSPGLGFDRVEAIPGETYKDNSTIVIVPSRDRSFHYRVVNSWQALLSPMNSKRLFWYCIGDEVGHAYNRMIQSILDHPDLRNWKYVMTLEADNIQPQDAHIRLLESIEKYHLDAVSGIYFTKGDINMPMAYGNPDHHRNTGILEFEPRDIREALAKGQMMEVNGIAMGCSLYRLDLFKQIPSPWFVTVNDVIPNVGPQGFTQDLYFCKRAKEAGKTFGVDMRVKVGHIDLVTDQIY